MHVDVFKVNDVPEALLGAILHVEVRRLLLLRGPCCCRRDTNFLLLLVLPAGTLADSSIVLELGFEGQLDLRLRNHEECTLRAEE